MIQPLRVNADALFVLIQREGWAVPCFSLYLSHPIVIRRTQSRHLSDSTRNSRRLNLFSFSQPLKMRMKGKRERRGRLLIRENSPPVPSCLLRLAATALLPPGEAAESALISATTQA